MGINSIFGFPMPALAADDAGGGGGDGDPGGHGSQGVSGDHPAGGGEGGESAGGGEGQDSGNTGTGMLGDAIGGSGDDGSEGGEGEGKPGDDDGRPTYTVTDEQGNEVQRPIPDQFWDAENGQVRVDSMAKSWHDTRQALEQAKKQGDAPQAPESADDYEVKLPEGVQADDLDDEAVGVMKQSAHKAGMSQEQFEAFIADFAEGLNGLEGSAPDPQAERAKLGDKADEIIGGTSQWLNNLEAVGAISADHKQALAQVGNTAEGVKALDNIRRHYTGEQQIPVDSKQDSGLPSKQELYKKVSDPRYQSDPEFRKQVEREFEEVFGDSPSGSSPNALGIE